MRLVWQVDNGVGLIQTRSAIVIKRQQELSVAVNAVKRIADELGVELSDGTSGK